MLWGTDPVTVAKPNRSALGVYRFGNCPLDGLISLGWKYRPKRPDAEKSLAAGIAAVGRESQQPFDQKQSTVVNALSRNAVEIEVAALGAMRQMKEAQRHSPRIKAQFACLAAPGTASRQCEKEVSGSGTVGAETFGAAALRANHQYILSNLQQHSQNICPKQDSRPGFSTRVV